MAPAAGGAVLALSGGVGGAKLALGLADALPDGQLHVVVNTGDDFRHLGLHISPDIDTLLYTLSGLSNEQQGWGVADETFRALEALGRLGAETWFLLGDRDLATHLRRTELLAAGRSLSEVTAELAARLGIGAHVYPMSDQPVRTTVICGDRRLPFQHYFVAERCEPAVDGFTFDGVEGAVPNPAVMSLLADDVPERVVICPSNPYVSIDPVLALPGFWQALRDCPAPVILVSPIVAGAALKGPAAKMMSELGVPASALGVARHYCERYPDLLDYFVIDASDGTLAPEIADLGVEVATTATVMKSREDKVRLAQFVLEIGHP